MRNNKDNKIAHDSQIYRIQILEKNQIIKKQN